MTKWKVAFHDRFKGEITDLPADVRVELLAHLVLLREKGFVSQKLFYKRLIDLADKRYDEHLSELEKKHG